jgi:DNA processing protein
MAPENLVPWVAVNLLQKLSPLQIRRALREFGSPLEVAFRVPVARLAAALGLKDGRAEAVAGARLGLKRRVDEEIRSAERLGVRLVTMADPDYPAEFGALPDGPAVLYLKGSLSPGVVRIAVVGSRRATAYGRRIASGLAAGLAAQGVEIVSGGARGVDTCAHLGALDAGCRTVAVMGSGFLCPYPSENQDLFDRIAKNGAVMTEFPMNMEPRGENFPRRNRLIAGLAAAVVVVEAAERSGSLSTASHALEQGREVMAVPGPVSSEQSAGCHRLIQQGAKLVHSVADVLEELSPMYSAALSPKAVPADESCPNLSGIGPDEATVLALLDDPEPVQLDALADRAPFGIARLQTALFGLEVRGAVEQLPGGYYLARLRRGADA